jgi:hypothetical protein
MCEEASGNSVTRTPRVGYKFGFHTHFVIALMKSHELTFCCDYGYRKVAKDIYEIS